MYMAEHSNGQQTACAELSLYQPPVGLKAILVSWYIWYANRLMTASSIVHHKQRKLADAAVVWHMHRCAIRPTGTP